jgi:hypothetical protein
MNSTIDQFNKIAHQLLEELSEITDSPKIKMGKSVLRTIIEKNPEHPIEQFILKLLPFKEHIFSKNEVFFLEEDFSDDESLISELLKMKYLWKRLSGDNKEIVFQYLIQLSIASEYYLKVFLEKN